MRAREFGLGTVAAIVLLASVSAEAPTRQIQPTWSKDVAPLVFSRCAVCHNDGGHAPFPLVTYDDVKRRWELVRQVVLNLQMPPCGFSSDFGDFCLSTPLDDAQRLMLQEWIRAGMPEGVGAPAPPVVKTAFRLGTPDIVLRPPAPPKVPTEGNPVWRAVLIDPKNDKPLHVRAFDVLPGEPKAVRHVLLAVASEKAWMNVWPTNGTLDDDASRLIGAWAPGYPAWQLPKGVSITLQPGEKLVAQVLFQTTGKKETPLFDIGLYLSNGQHDREAYWISREKSDFEIRAFSDLTITTTVELEKDVDLLAIVPEARFFAYVIDVQAKRADGGSKTLLRTVRWIPYWNGSFVFPVPVPLDKGTSIVSSTVYENEAHSPINEGVRPRLVRSGTGLDQEVCRTHYLVVDRAGR